MSSDMAAQLKGITSSRVSLAEAIHQLNLASTAFSRMKALEEEVAGQAAQLTDVRNLVSGLITHWQFDRKLTEIELSLDNKVENTVNKTFASCVRSLASKVEVADLNELLRTKCSVRDLHVISQEIKGLKGVIEKHVNYEYPDFVSKMKMKLRAKVGIEVENNVTIDNGNEGLGRTEEQLREIPCAAARENTSSEDTLEGMLRKLEMKILKEEYFPVQNTPRPQVKLSETTHAESYRPIADVRTLKRRSTGHARSTSRKLSQTPQQICRSLLVLKKEIDTLKKDFLEAKCDIHRFSKKIDQAVPTKEPTKTTKEENRETAAPLAQRLRLEEEKRMKRTSAIEHSLFSIKTDTETMKKLYREKFAEIIGHHNTVNQNNEFLQKAFEGLRAHLAELSLSQRTLVKYTESEISVMKGGLTDLISNQHREIQALTGDIQRQQADYRNLLEEFAGSLPANSLQKTLLSSQQLSSQRVKTPSPSLSVKRRHYGSTVLTSALKSDENWLRDLDEGQGLPLPRLSVRKQRKLSSCSTAT